MADLERVRPGVKDRLVDWLLNYKTSDGKPQNTLSSMEPTSVSEALGIIGDVNKFYKDLVATGSTKNIYGFSLPSWSGSSTYASATTVSSAESKKSAPQASSSTYGVTVV
jgi:hypothetical protein